PRDAGAPRLQTSSPAASARGWIAGCPGPVNVSATTPQTCPIVNNFVFNGSSPNTDTWYTGRVDYTPVSKQRLFFSFNYFPTTTSYVPADPLFPNDATAYEVGKTDDITGHIYAVYRITSLGM